MSRQRSPLPSALGRQFSVDDARRLAVSRTRLDGADLQSPTRGVRVREHPTNLLERAAAFALVLPAPFAFSHLSAARLLGWPLPNRWTPDEQLHVMRPRGTALLTRDGVTCHRGLESRQVLQTQGLPVAAAADTWCDLATLFDVSELVVCADAALAKEQVSVADLQSAIIRRPGRRGIKALGDALPMTRNGSRSRPETLIRLAFDRAGFPQPALNADVHDTQGRWVANCDFVWHAERLIVEYDGEHHRDRRQWSNDHLRRRDMAALGWRIVVLTAADLSNEQTVDRFVAEIRTALGPGASKVG